MEAGRYNIKTQAFKSPFVVTLISTGSAGTGATTPTLQASRVPHYSLGIKVPELCSPESREGPIG